MKWQDISGRLVTSVLLATLVVCGLGQGYAFAQGMPMPGGTPNYFGPEPNWAWSPAPTVDPGTGAITGGIRKFVDSLPGLGAAGANNLGQYIPVAVADTTTYPGSDYYEIAVVEYTQQMHSDLLPTTLRGYVQLATPVVAGAVALTNPDGTPILKSDGTQAVAVDIPRYLGPIIVAQKDRPVRVKFSNLLPTGMGGDLFIPVDTTEMGAGMGPLGMNTTPGFPMNYTQNRATLHLHGGRTPWISDGTPHQWTTPAGEGTDYPDGVSCRNVPDMPDPGPGSITFFYSNQQSARLMFYHDHAYGITRLNVYAGEAAGYLITDAVEQDLVARGIIPADQIPLVIQDRTFVDPTTVLMTDPTWPFPVDTTKSNFWYPHVYMTNQNPNDLAGVNPMGRWDYGPWFWPPWPTAYPPITLPDGTVLPNVPNLSMTMEAFHDTPVINGTAYPYLDVDPKAYRFRILNAANDRFVNLTLWLADPTITTGAGVGTEVKTIPSVPGTWPAGWPTPDARDGGLPDPTLMGPNMIQIGTEGGFLPAPVVWPNIPIGYDRDTRSITIGNVKEHNLFLGCAERADVIIDFSAFAGQTLIFYNDSPAPTPATDPRLDYYTGHPDLTATGGNGPTLPGYGPNIRTIMQIRVRNTTPAPAFDLAALNAEFASTATTQGVFARGQDPILVPQAPYNSAYNASFPAGTTAYARIQSTSLTFTPLGAAAPLTITFKPKAIQELFENWYGRMSGFLGVEIPFTNGINQTTIDYGYIDPATELVDDSVTTAPVTPGDGTQIWKITHNGVDTHPVHFHLFDVQVINRVDWAGVVKPPEPNELGWKETVRMNPLEDCIVAVRAVAPKQPFGLPDSVRPYDPTMPLGSGVGFRNIDPNGNPIVTTNQLYNFGWEYVWHCHILSHEEMDMMRPMVFNVARQLPAAPVLSATGTPGSPIALSWTDGTPAAAPTTPGNPANEIGFRIERQDGPLGTFAAVGTALANQTLYADGTTTPGMAYFYRVVAFNAAGDSPSNQVLVGTPPPIAAPSGLSASIVSESQVDLRWTDNSNVETSFVVYRSVNGAAFAQLAALARTPADAIATGGTVTFIDTGVASGSVYAYYVTAVNSMSVSSPSNTATVTVSVPAAPTNLVGTAARIAGNLLQDRVTLTWRDNSNNEASFQIQRATNPNFNNPTTFTVGANVTTFVQNVPRNTTYSYRVRAINVLGNSGWSNSVRLTTP
jgi:FtsP/CotA-like multicopper oxidase with cupredoxin domain